MTLYVVLAPPAEAGSVGPEPDRFVLVKEGFCWPAFYLTIPWLAWHRMWLVLAAYVLVTASFVAFAGRAPPPVTWASLVLFGVLVGLEGNNLRRWTLERSGFRYLGIAAGDRRNEAEYRFFAAWMAAKPSALDDAPKPAASKPNSTARADTDEVIGLFPTPNAGRSFRSNNASG